MKTFTTILFALVVTACANPRPTLTLDVEPGTRDNGYCWRHNFEPAVCKELK